jgi:hypothetical protein
MDDYYDEYDEVIKNDYPFSKSSSQKNTITFGDIDTFYERIQF